MHDPKDPGFEERALNQEAPPRTYHYEVIIGLDRINKYGAKGWRAVSGWSVGIQHHALMEAPDGYVPDDV